MIHGLLALWLAAGIGAAAAATASWPIDWQVNRHLDHALVGQIWRPEAQTWATPAQLRTAVSNARFVLLGETHDNPDHHRLQAQLLQAMVAAGRRPTVAFEMLDLSQQPALTDFLRDAPNDATALGLDKPWPAARREALRQRLYVSHCKLVPKSALTGMIHAQRTRNAIMAQRLLQTASADGAVLITGSGHARTDYGVPLNLRDKTASSPVLSVALIEVRRDKRKAPDYAGLYNTRRLPFDYVLFTPATERENPCARLRAQFDKSKQQ